jgi:hypothetical protein
LTYVAFASSFADCAAVSTIVPDCDAEQGAHRWRSFAPLRPREPTRIVAATGAPDSLPTARCQRRIRPFRVALNVPFAPTPATVGSGTSCETVNVAVKTVVPAETGLELELEVAGEGSVGVAGGDGAAGAGGDGEPPLDEKCEECELWDECELCDECEL